MLTNTDMDSLSALSGYLSSVTTEILKRRKKSSSNKLQSSETRVTKTG